MRAIYGNTPCQWTPTRKDAILNGANTRNRTCDMDNLDRTHLSRDSGESQEAAHDETIYTAGVLPDIPGYQIWDGARWGWCTKQSS